jgi:NTE family protein
LVDFKRLRAQKEIEVMVCATNVRNARRRTFSNADISSDAVLASACLPDLFPAVEIDGEAYWDGGYAGNPTMAPLVRECGSRDAILVQINPIERPGTPRSAREIHNRLNEVAFNATLIKELRAAALLKRVVDPGKGEGAVWAEMRVHRIASDIMVQLGYSSKLIAEWNSACCVTKGAARHRRSSRRTEPTWVCARA